MASKTTNWNKTAEKRQKQSEFMQGNKFAFGSKRTAAHKRKMSVVMKGVNSSVAKRQKQSEFMRGNKNLLGHKHSDETKRKLKVSSARYKHSEEAKKKISAALGGLEKSEDHKKKLSESAKQLWNDPIHHKKQRRLMALGNVIKPNKSEIKLMELLESIQPKDWKYVGDGSLVIAGKNPDFINVNGKKLIIEMFGDYWHRNDSVRKRAAIFRPFGFRTLVIWEHELKNEVEVIKKIMRFAAGARSNG